MSNLVKRRGTWKVAQSAGWESRCTSVMTWLGLESGERD